MQSQSEIYKSKSKDKISNSQVQQEQPQQPQQQSQEREKYRQQQQQQQPQQSVTGVSTKSTTAEGSEAVVVGAGKNPPLPQRRATVKVIKCKKPLCHFKFYLDICDHQLTKRIEEQIRTLGGTLEFFLTSSVTHFITDKAILPPIVGNNNSNNNNNNNNSLSSRPGTPQTPGTPSTPQAPYSFDTQDGKNNASGGNSTPTGSAKKTNNRQTRANAILNRVRRPSTTANTINVNAVSIGVNEPQNSPTPLNVKDVVKQSSIVATQSSYIVWQTEYALHFFKKVHHELKDYLGVNSRHDQHKLLSKGRNTVEPIDLKGGGFIKIEAIKHNYRPYYQLFRKSSGTEWPKIELTREDGAFRLSPKKKITPNVELREKEKDKTNLNKANEERNMTRKSRSRSSQHQRPLHAAVQSLKKGTGGAAADSATTVKSSPRNSQAGGVAGAIATGCRQVKESSDKQCGVCEICKIEYDTLTIHLKTKDHEYFAKNSQNFIALDSLIHTSADVNKFLNEDKKVVLEEMEVENIEMVGDVNAPDPLEGSEPLMVMPLLELADDTRRGGLHQTPSPTLREKSKRSTKGKHSSEKFQNIRSTKSPKATSTAIKSQTSPLKQQTAFHTATSSMLELQRIETCATVNVNATKPAAVQSVTPAASTRRKQTSVATVSPPIRAMLPPSSLYKVVGTPETVGTPVRRTRGDFPSGGDQAVTASPSLIVKFKKVRATELNRLNGEAESFMFPKQRTSSELPTDTDRQTTSENARGSFSSTSIDSTSDGPMEVELATAAEHSDKTAVGSKEVGKRAIANAKRRKSQTSTTTKQRFPTAPIQPELQLKNKPGSGKSVSTKPLAPVGNSVTETTKSAISAAAAKANAAAAALAAITLPEATRKSSRTATAIVTAATTSSRLLRAAVEAAKHNYRQMAAANDLVGTGRKRSSASESTIKSLTTATSPSSTKTSQSVSVVKMEDRMGDVENIKKENENESEGESESESTSNYEDDDENCADTCKGFEAGYFAEDLDEDDDDDIDNDDANDEDYVHYKSRRHKSVSFDNSSDIWQSGCSGATSRRQRAMKREEQKTKSTISPVETKDCRITKIIREVGRGRKRKKCSEESSKNKIPNAVSSAKSNKSSSIEMTSQTPSPSKRKSPEAFFDYTASERLNQMRYSFERIPASDLWYRVFSRQDNWAENFFEYYGSTNYRKLPYELGPIPFGRTSDSSVCCKLCESQRNISSGSNEASKEFPSSENVCKVKSEPLEDSEAGATKSRDSSSCNSNDIANTTNPCSTENANTTQYKHKHKKLQILQRYRQEQQELQKRQAEQVSALQENNSCQSHCDTKATCTSVPERARDRQRAGSTHSTTSSTSCASSTATTKTSKNRYLNKHLNKAAAAFLNLELPPRKSPREHASTLALVSCIIKQRQDSQSKPNSETDEPPTIPTPVSVTETATVTTPGSELALAINSAIKTKAEKVTSASMHTDSACSAKPLPTVNDLPVLRSPRHTRSAAATPVEELRFTTEISENVKRMRRGQNKYDHSPPIALNPSRKSTRGGRQILKSPHGRPSRTFNSVQKFLHSAGRTSNRMSQTPNSMVVAATPTTKRRRRGYAARRHNCYSGLLGQGSVLPSIRKTGSKKGVLEFEVDTAALKALDAATKHTNIRQLEWQIDKYLELHGSEYDLEEDLALGCDGAEAMPLATIGRASKKHASTPASAIASTSKTQRDAKQNSSAAFTSATFDSNTPPPTDCFSSDFDLYDLFTNAAGGSPSEDEQTINVGGKRRSTGPCLYNSLSMQNYFRKRKCLKSNRTGWPKVQKKKTSARQQQKLAQKIRFLQDIGELTSNMIKGEPDLPEQKEGDEVEGNDESLVCRGLQRRRRNGVITPPQSEGEVNQKLPNDVEDDEEEEETGAGDDDDTELDAAESIPEEEEDEDAGELEDDGETTMDSIDEEGVQTEPDADAAAEADEEDIEDAELYTAAVGTVNADEDDSNFVPMRKSIRRRTNASPLEDKLITSNSFMANGSTNININSAATSTPSTQMLRGSARRTPQLLNGSLGSCISPSEKAGDNSDIFTVSSDGLDTDLDVSNSQHKCDDEHLHYHHQHQHHNHHHHHHHHPHLHHQDQCASHPTPKRKFDLSKYAPNNTTASSCAAEAATAAVKSLAISQFLKKEVRVTCRRLRAPFRRYRYRR